MLKVVLADDNILTLNQVADMLSQEEMGAIVLGQAMDGKAAADMILKFEPDLVITDVEMPGLNGMELSRFILDNKLTAKLIALSNYDNYDYVRTILKNGAVDYLLKSEITYDVLLRKVKEVRMILKSEEGNSAHGQVQTLLAKQFFLTGLLLDMKETEHQETMLMQREFNKCKCSLLLLQISNYTILFHNIDVKEKKRLSRSILGILNNVCTTLGNGIACSTSEDDECAILFSFYDLISENKLYQQSIEYASVLTSNLVRLLGIHCAFEIIVFDNPIFNIRQAYLRLKQKLENRGTLNIVDSEIVSKAELDLQTERSLIEALTMNNANSIREIVECIVLRGSNYRESQILANQLLTIGERFLRMHPHLMAEQIPKDFRGSFYKDLPLNRMQGMLTAYLQDIGQSATSFRSKYSPYVRKAISYIEDNYANPITLDSTAETCGISSVYLSKIFHNEVGFTFTEYLVNTRIEAAKMLLQSDLSIKEICAKIGFPNYNYFIKLFREQVGITPYKYARKKSVL